MNLVEDVVGELVRGINLGLCKDLEWELIRDSLKDVVREDVKKE